MADTEIKLSATQAKIVDELNKLSALELSQVVKHLEGEWGVSASAPVAVSAPATASEATEEATTKTEFKINLQDAGNQKVAVIKAVKEITGLGLGEAKALVDGVPSTIKEKATKEEADNAKKLLEEAGAKVELV